MLSCVKEGWVPRIAKRQAEDKETTTSMEVDSQRVGT